MREPTRRNVARWRARDPEHVRQLERDRIHQDPEKHRRRVARWRANNAERARELGRLQYHANKDKRRASGRRSREKRMAQYRATFALWLQANTAKIAAYAAVRRARKKAATAGDLKAIEAVYAYAEAAATIACYWCGAATALRSERHVDHRIPLIKGGKHAAENLVIACVSCNTRKHRMLPDEWIAVLEAELSELRRGLRAGQHSPADV
jgi:5-methylcytosine-specific restriction endonuclease McrA